MVHLELSSRASAQGGDHALLLLACSTLAFLSEYPCYVFAPWAYSCHLLPGVRDGALSSCPEMTVTWEPNPLEDCC